MAQATAERDGILENGSLEEQISFLNTYWEEHKDRIVELYKECEPELNDLFWRYVNRDQTKSSYEKNPLSEEKETKLKIFTPFYGYDEFKQSVNEMEPIYVAFEEIFRESPEKISDIHEFFNLTSPIMQSLPNISSFISADLMEIMPHIISGINTGASFITVGKVILCAGLLAKKLISSALNKFKTEKSEEKNPPEKNDAEDHNSNADTIEDDSDTKFKEITISILVMYNYCKKSNINPFSPFDVKENQLFWCFSLTLRYTGLSDDEANKLETALKVIYENMEYYLYLVMEQKHLINR